MQNTFTTVDFLFDPRRWTKKYSARRTKRKETCTCVTFVSTNNIQIKTKMNFDYGTCLTNLEDFRNNAPETSIKFLFFYSTDLARPKIKDVFRKWNDHYLLPGVTVNNVYVYRESSIKYLVSAAVSTGRTNEYNVTIQQRNNTNGDVNHGDHVDFGIRRQRDGSVLVLSHKTHYWDTTGNFEFDRRVRSCDFKIRNTTDIGTLAHFSRNTDCTEMSGVVTGQVHNMYSVQDVSTVYGLCKIMTEGYVATLGGSLPKPKRYMYHNSKRCLLRSRGGQHFVRTHKKDVFLQKGGAGYKGITFVCDAFISFLSERFFKPLYAVRGTDLISAQLIYDELNELSQNGNRHFVLLYDFERGTRNIFYINFVLASVSCYATDLLKKSNEAVLTAYEKRCLNRFDEMYSSLIPVS
jgi:hypothetical protein